MIFKVVVTTIDAIVLMPCVYQIVREKDYKTFGTAIGIITLNLVGMWI